MRPENEARLRKIKRISGILRMVCKVILVSSVLLFLIMTGAWVVSAVKFHGFFWWGGYNDPVMFRMTAGDEIVICAYYALRWTAMFLCVFYLHRLLGNYSRGEIFTQDSSRQIRRWGLACVLWGVMSFLWIFVPGAVFTHPAPYSSYGHIADNGCRDKPQQGDWRIDGRFVQPHGGGMMVNGLIIVAISWFMEMAAEIREEQELT